MDPNQDNSQISADQGDINRLQSNLQSSPTAFTPGATPSNSDITNDSQLTALRNSLNTLQANKINTEWYGPSTAASDAVTGADATASGDTGATPSNPFMGAINALQRPLNAITGAINYGLGKSDQSNIIDAINQNMDTNHVDFGNIMQEYGAPLAVSAPLGLALDIAFDPVNWATAGTGALIPRLGYGLIKGGLEGGIEGAADAVKEGAISNLGGKAAKLGSFIPGVRNSSTLSNLSNYAANAGTAYNAATGIDPLANLGKGIFGLSNSATGRTLGAGVENLIRNYIPHGNQIVDSMKYSNSDWIRASEKIDDLTQQFNNTGRFVQQLPNAAENNALLTPENFERMQSQVPSGTSDPFAQEDLKNVDDMSDIGARNAQLDPSLGEDGDAIKQTINDAAYAATDGAPLARVSDPSTWTDTMREEANLDDNMKQLLTKYAAAEGSTGSKYLDNMIQSAKDYKIKNIPVFEKTMNVYNSLIDWFKRAHIVYTPMGNAIASAGNLGMFQMAGVDLTDPALWANMKDNIYYSMGKAKPDFLLNNFLNEGNGWADYMRDQGSTGTTFKKVTGYDPRTITAQYMSDKMLAEGRLQGIVNSKNADQMTATMAEQWAEAKKAAEAHAAMQGNPSEFGASGKGVEAALSGSNRYQMTPLQALKASGGVASSAEMPVGFLGNELYSKNYLENFLSHVSDKAKSDGGGWKVLDSLLNKTTSGYERMDQGMGNGFITYAVKDGVNINTLRQLARITPGGISADSDILSDYVKNGQRYYRLAPQKAVELSREILTNYAAMPGFVKIMRSLPIMGSPFFSFQYGMMSKVGKSLMHNPSAFNKIAFALNEFSGEKSPLEKEALTSPYNSYLNQQGMWRLPFFQQNPVYMNLSGLIPYYSMNAFTPSERKYGDTLPDSFLKTMDNLPLMKDPVGQMLFNYVIQPALLRGENEQVQGQFGQPLAPIGASAGTQAAYAGQSLLDSVTPGYAQYLGLPAGLVGGSYPVSQYLPGYRTRQMANAVAGENTLGAVTKEPPVQKTIRAILSSVGIPLDPVNMTYVNEAANNTQ